LARGALALGSGFSFSGWGRRHAGLVQEQRGLGRGKLFALGSPEAQVEQADFLVLDLQEFDLFLNDLRLARVLGDQARVLGLQALEGLAGFGWQRVERNHIIRITYIIRTTYTQH
jgi:hypothetical protein